MFDNIFTNMFHVLTKIKFKKITFISSKYANDSQSFYGFLYRKAEEIIEWYAAFNKKEHTIFRVYDLIGSKSKYQIDAGSLNSLF
jgi:UDP-glucose 4-epimerase